MDNFDVKRNYTVYLTGLEDEVHRVADPDYEQFLADVWVGIVLTLMVLSCVCCMCSCLLYHKFQQWKRSVLEARRNASNAENGQAGDSESLPSYTIVSGLPSYDEAIEQLRQVRNQSKSETSAEIKDAYPRDNTEGINNGDNADNSDGSQNELIIQDEDGMKRKLLKKLQTKDATEQSIYACDDCSQCFTTLTD
ncbi:comm3 [Carabus blaptoides fortunei]